MTVVAFGIDHGDGRNVYMCVYIVEKDRENRISAPHITPTLRTYIDLPAMNIVLFGKVNMPQQSWHLCEVA